MIKNSQKKQQFKKQALQLILSIYLKRQNDEDVQFIRQNIKSTSQFAHNVSSNIKYGLNQDMVQKNKFMYGKNSKRFVKTIDIKDIVFRVIKTHNILITIISMIQVIFGKVLHNRQIYMDAVYVLIIQFCVLLIRIITIYFNQRKKSEQSYQKNKNQKYRVFRDGTFVQIPQTKIVVGDIVQLDYKQKVPASGILITNQQIAMNQQKFGKKIQKKMCIQKSISYINKLSHLQLKIDAQKQALPSPILIRGTYQIYGSTYRMMVTAVQEQNLLDKYKIPQDPTFVSNVIRNWFSKHEQKSSTIMKIIKVLILISFIFLFALKQFLQRHHLSGEMFFTDLFSVLLMSIMAFSVFDTNCLRLFFQTQVISYTQSLNNPKQVDKYLTVEQIFITQDNIVKYDNVSIGQIGLPDKDTIFKYQDMNILSTNTKQKIQQVLQGLGLRKDEKTKQLNKKLKNQFKQDCQIFDPNNRSNKIIHVNTVDQKIFSTLYNKTISQNQENIIANNQTSLIMNSNPHQQQNASNISFNRVTPLEQDQPFNFKIKQTKIKRKQLSISKKVQHHPIKQSNRQSNANDQTLKGYLSQFCKFKTQNIVQSIVQLAKQESKTYYYQKYTLNRLKKIPYVYLNRLQLQMTKQRIQKAKRISRNIRSSSQNKLTPFLIGYSDGAYNNSNMNVLVAIIGVEINYQNDIIQRLQQLSKLGINSTILINQQQQEENSLQGKQNILLQSKMTAIDPQEEQDYIKIILNQYMNRGWISQGAQEIIDFKSIKQSGGIVRCQNCFLSICDCKNRVEQLSNIQGFMYSSQNTKIIHSIQSQADIEYLEIGSEQIKNSVILISKYKSDTIKILQDIKKGYYLSNILERGLNVWFGFMFVSATCFYPLALVSFGGVFCSGDLSLWTLFIQSLPAIGNLDFSVEQRQKLQGNSRKNKVLYSKKSTLSVCLLCLISTIIATIIYIKPTIFIEQKYDGIAGFIQQKSSLQFYKDCTYQFSIFISDQFNKIKCHSQYSKNKNYSQFHTPKDFDQLPQYIYSQNVNFIFSYLCLNMFIFLMINFKNFTKIKFLLLYTGFFSIYFFVIYVTPDIIHGRFDGLTGGQLVIVFSMSILTNLVIQCIGYFMNYSCSVCDTQQFQKILSFEQNIQQHYSTKLKKYNSFQTEIYKLT